MLGRKALLILITNSLGAITGAASLFFVTRYMGPDLFGMYGFALSMVSIGALVTRMGIDNAHVKRVSEGLDLSRAIGTYARLKLVLIVIFAVGTVGAVTLWAHFRGFTDSTTLPIVLFVVGYVVLLEIRVIPATTFDGLRQTARTQTLNVVEHLTKAPLLIAVAILYRTVNGKWVPSFTLAQPVIDKLGLTGPWTMETGAILIAVANGLAMLASLGVGIILLRRHKIRGGPWEKEVSSNYVAFALPIALVSSLHLMAKHLDAFMLGYFWSSKDVGYYLAAQRVSTMVIIIPVAIRTLFFPLISELSQSGSRVAVQEVARTTQRALSLVIVPVVMLVLVYATEGVHIFMSDSFLPAAPVLQLLGIYTLILSFTAVASSLVMGFNKPKTVAMVGLVSVVVNVALNVIFIPTSILGVPLLGMRGPGAALATVIAQTITLVLLGWHSRRITKVSYIGWPVVKHLLAASITGVVLHLATVPLFGSADRVWELLGACTFGMLLYGALLALLGEISRKDLILLQDILNPGRMKEYVRDEVVTRTP